MGKSVTLHLLPGVLIFTFYIATAPVAIRLGFPSDLAFLAGLLLVGIPFELGYMLYQGRRRNGVFSLRGIVRYREPMRLRQYAVLFVALLAWAIIVALVITPLTDSLANGLFSWLPDFLLPDGDAPVPEPTRAAALSVLLLALAVDGLMNPTVEELYFRGFLLPRVSRLGWLSPAINAALFTLAHFWQPFNYPLIFLLQLPLVYIVYWKRNIYIAILAHSAGNLIGAGLSLADSWL